MGLLKPFGMALAVSNHDKTPNTRLSELPGIIAPSTDAKNGDRVAPEIVTPQVRSEPGRKVGKQTKPERSKRTAENASTPGVPNGKSPQANRQNQAEPSTQ